MEEAAVTRIEIAQVERTALRRMALWSAISGTVLGVVAAAGSQSPRWWILPAVAAPFWVVAWYYIRVSSGWIRVGTDGLHTSRRVRGRFIAWTELADLSERIYEGGTRSRPGQITVIRARTRGGRAYLLPAPRTVGRDTVGFQITLRALRREANRRGARLGGAD